MAVENGKTEAHSIAILAQARCCVSASSRWAARVPSKVVHRADTGFQPVIEYTFSSHYTVMRLSFLDPILSCDSVTLLFPNDGLLLARSSMLWGPFSHFRLCIRHRIVKAITQKPVNFD